MKYDPSLQLIRAQVAFRLLRGDTWEAIMQWWRKRYPGTDVSIAFEVRETAERNAAIAAKFRQLRKDQKLKDAL